MLACLLPEKKGHLGAKLLVFFLVERGFGFLTLQNEKTLDNLSWQILRELQKDARLSYNELGRRVGLSAPSVAERVRKLEEAGVIGGYKAHIELANIGLPITAFIHLRCTLGRCLLNTARMEDYPEIFEVHKVSGRHCTMLRVAAASVKHLDILMDRLSRHGEVEMEIVLSSPLPDRDVDWEKGHETLRAITEFRWDEK